MKDKSFIIKVGDLLQEGGKSDSIDFSEKISQQLPELNKDGISGTVVLNSMNQDSLYVRLEDIHCTVEEQCDRCERIYSRIVDIPKYIARFVANEERKKEEEGNSDEEIFVINARDETIDIEPMVIQAIVLEEPFVKHCPACKEEIGVEIYDEDIDEEMLGKGNIIFH